MKSNILSLIIVVFLVSCKKKEMAIDVDEKLVGTWHSNDGGNYELLSLSREGSGSYYNEYGGGETKRGEAKINSKNQLFIGRTSLCTIIEFPVADTSIQYFLHPNCADSCVVTKVLKTTIGVFYKQ